MLDIHNISGERHQIPTTSPFTVRLLEVPQKTEPTSLSVTCNGTAMTEVAATPEQGQFFPDYRANVTGDPNWNRGELLFNAADAGKWITVNYRGMGTLIDSRLPDQLQMPFTGSQQADRETNLRWVPNSWDSQEGQAQHDPIYGGKLRRHRGIPAGTYSLREILQKLINLSSSTEFVRTVRECDCNCGDGCSDDTGP
ncbi:hypothetical protein Acin_1225 [Acidaminococcus intestini RyC-MR95]|uniref:Uncharacterized protein n=1 Tax=Acidaminococcus intestini (strain RyC-MR95) TaxID=568816 RepID=G4Q8B9_ACIIR|nr:hypothetical protein Acin_1225 [Acidaminococcus intestini RyC-MR95]